MEKPKAVLFDLDGVLIDATEWHYDALNDALRIFGWEITREMHISFYNGLPTKEKLRYLSEQEGLPKSLHPIIHKLKRKYTDDKVYNFCRPNYGKQLLMTYLKQKGYMLACCSNAQKYSVLNMLSRADIEKYFDLIIGNDEGFAPKPSPEIYQAAFKALGILPEEAIIVEDAPHGIAAAKASGSHVIEVGGFDEVNLDLFIHQGL